MGVHHGFQRLPTYLEKNDANSDYELQTNQAAGVFLRWLWKESKAEILCRLSFKRF
jgi:hypothetical protein